MRWIVVLVGCGRIGFDPAAPADGAACVEPPVNDWTAREMPNDPGSDLPHLASYAIDADTVTDAVTGLVWQRTPPAELLSFTDALTYCSTLVLGECDRWRVPARAELVSLIDHALANPTIDPDAFPNTAVDQLFWTQTADVANPNLWTVNFSNGNSFTESAADHYHVRCARAGAAGTSPPERYVVDADTVGDLATGLTWQRTAGAATYTMTQAQVYCAGLAGGWRLPSVNELQTLVDTSRVDPAIDPTAFAATPSVDFWSTTRIANDDATGMVVSFRDGVTNNDSVTTPYPARCVR